MPLLMPPPLIALLSALAIWAAHKFFGGLSVSFPFQTPLAVLVAVTGVSLDLAALMRFLKRKTTIDPRKPNKTDYLVTDGIYRFSRNPMYLGLLLLLSAWTLYLGAPLGILLLAIFVSYMTQFQIKPEERILREKFGAAFEEYCEGTRRWI